MNFDPAAWTAITALLKSVKNVPVLRRSQANRMNWLDEYEAAHLPEKIWVVDVRESYEEPWATDTNSYRYPLMILYLRPANLHALETAAGVTVEALIEGVISQAREAFVYYVGAQPPAFQLAGKLPTRSISDYDAYNDIMFELQNRFIGGGFMVEPLVGDYPA